MLNFQDSVRDSLFAVSDLKDEEMIRSVAAGVLITSEIINNKKPWAKAHGFLIRLEAPFGRL